MKERVWNKEGEWEERDGKGMGCLKSTGFLIRPVYVLVNDVREFLRPPPIPQVGPEALCFRVVRPCVCVT